MKYTCLAILLLLNSFSFSQTKGKLESTRLVNLDIMHVSPQKPPKIDLVFRAQASEDGEPIWDLGLKDLQVFEDSMECEILSLDKISTNKPINITLVIDHSGSMSIGIPTLTDIYNILTGKAKYVSPLDHAKISAKVFASSFNTSKDQVGIVSFGSSVDVNELPTNDTSKIYTTINKIHLSGATAYYDGLLAGIEQLRKRKGVNIIVSLTDGAENSSTHSLKDVVDASRKHNIPIYTIGLGLVEKDTLSLIADTTNGEFYHTNSPSELVEIYTKISKQIQAYYALEYISPFLKKANKEKLTIDFTSESPFLKNVPNDPEVIAYLEKKKFDEQLRFYGKIAVVVIVAAGIITILYYRRRRKKLLNG